MALRGNEAGKLEKNCFFAPFPAPILARSCTPVLHMAYSTDDVCPSYKGQGVNLFLWSLPAQQITPMK